MKFNLSKLLFGILISISLILFCDHVSGTPPEDDDDDLAGDSWQTKQPDDDEDFGPNDVVFIPQVPNSN